MARDTRKVPDKKKQDRRPSEASRIIDLSATEIVALPASGEPPAALPHLAGGTELSEPGVFAQEPNEPEAVASNGVETSPEESVIYAGPPAPESAAAPELAADTSLSPAERDAPASSADAGEADSPMEPVAAAAFSNRSRPEPEQHGLDPAVFEPPSRAPGALGAIVFGGLAGIAASVLVLLALSTLDLLPGVSVRDVQQRLAGVEASIRSVIEARPNVDAELDSAGLQQRLAAAEADTRATREQVVALQGQVAGVGERLASVPAAPPAPDAEGDAAGDSVAPLAAELESVKGQVSAVQANLAALPQDIGGEISGLQTQLAALNEKLGMLEPRLQELAQKQDELASGLTGVRDTLTQVSQTQAGFADLAKRQDELTTGFAGLLASSKTVADNQIKIDALSGRVDAVAERQQAPDEDMVARRLVLLDLAEGNLRQGLPLAGELAALEQQGGTDAAALREVAAAGVPQAPVLAERARTALAGLARPAQPGSPFLQQLADSARSLVSITPAAGSNPAAGSASADPRTAFVDRLQLGDLAGALAAFEAMDSTGKAAVSDIASQARQRLAAEQNLAAIRGEALAAAAKRS